MRLLDNVNSPDDIKKMNMKSLNVLCTEIREFLIDTVSKTGGHLGSNLGVTELTVALHYCFNSPCDKIIWDVGHQAYVHKMLTGRKDDFHTLRKLNGLSGFPKPSESPHDPVVTGHSSTSISQALGIAKGRDLAGEKYKVISVIGDGSITGGLSYEAMNNAGQSNTDLIVILNDNQMSISENVGAVSRHLNDIRINPSYIEAKADVNKILKRVPVVGGTLGKILEKTKDGIKYLLVPGVLFEELGFKYIGPIDGHNMEELISVMKQARKTRGPVLLHVLTTKGKGYSPSEQYPAKFHGVDTFDIKTGRPEKTKIWDSYTDVFGKTIAKLAYENEKILAITAAMPESTGLSTFEKRYPERMFDVGIAEAHAVTFAAGLAASGYIPFFAVYSSFLQRGYDQLIHDVCLQNRHVVFAIDRAGIVGPDGETHQGLFDLSFLSHLPNMAVMAPKNKKELKMMLAFAVEHKGPIAVRYPKGAASMVLGGIDNEIVYGKSELIYQGSSIALVSFGSMMDNVYEVFQKLKADGHDPTLINARFLCPMDLDMVKSLGNYDYVFSFEDNLKAGGFGACLLQNANEENIQLKNFYSFGFPKEFITHGKREELFDLYGLNTEKINQKIYEILNLGKENGK